MDSCKHGIIRFSWGTGYMELNTHAFMNLPKAKKDQIIKAVTKAAERSK